jgi:hypothetical protein
MNQVFGKNEYFRAEKDLRAAPKFILAILIQAANLPPNILLETDA